MANENAKDYCERTKEGMKHFPGLSTRLMRIFAYHYDQIQREVQTELSHPIQGDNPEMKDLAISLQDAIVEYMEEIMAWPEPEDLDKFINQISGLE